MARKIKPIRTESDHKDAMVEVARLWGAKLGTPNGDRLDVLVTLIEAYEEAHFPIDIPDPVAAIEFRMEQQGLVRKDLEPMIGSRTRVADILNRKRELSKTQIRNVSAGLNISADILISRSKGSPTAPLLGQSKTRRRHKA